MSKKSAGSHLIEIHVDSVTGNITYTPAVYHAKAGESVSWSANGDFAIVFLSGTPVKTLGIRGPRATEVETSIRADAARGVYHYAVAVFLEGKVFLDAGCPTIVID